MKKSEGYRFGKGFRSLVLRSNRGPRTFPGPLELTFPLPYLSDYTGFSPEAKRRIRLTSDRTLPPRTEDLATRDFPSAEKVSAHAGTEEDELPASEPSGLRKVVFHDVLPGIIVVLASLLMAFSYNAFLIPHKILSGGVAGVAMILSLFTPVSAGTYLFLLNVPLFVFGYFTLGRRFIRESALSVATLAVAMNLIPVRPLSNDPVISSVFGGALVGLGMGVIYRMAGSSGGIDIVAFYLARRRDFPMGTLLFSFNAAVVALAGVLLSPERALYTMLGMYVSSRVVDGVFTRHLKLTLFIVTQRGRPCAGPSSSSTAARRFSKASARTAGKNAPCS